MDGTLLNELNTIFESYGEISSSVCYKLKRALGNEHMPDCAVDTDTIAGVVKTMQPTYLDDSATCVSATDNFTYVWVPLGLSDARGEQLYLGFFKNEVDRLIPYCVSSYEYLLRKAKARSECIDDNEKSKPQKKIDIYDKIIELTGVAPKPFSESVYRGYLQSVFCKVQADFKNGEDAKYVKNTDETKICYKLALQNWMGENIIIIQSVLNHSVYEQDVVWSSEQLRQNHFSATVQDVPFVRLWDKPSDLIMDLTAGNLTCDDEKALTHILIERKDRFPAEMLQLSGRELYQSLKRNIEFNAAKVASDFKWAAPIYNYSTNRIYFLLPMYDDFSKNAKVALLINKTASGYRAETILDMKTAFYSASILSQETPSWLQEVTQE